MVTIIVIIFRLYDPCYVMDALHLTCSMNKLPYVSIDGAQILLSKAKILVESKYQVISYYLNVSYANHCFLFQSHIKFGFEFIKKILDQYKEVIVLVTIEKTNFNFHKEIINVKAFSQMAKIDLAREERMRKYNNLIEEFKQIYKISRIKKIADRKPNEEVIIILEVVNNNIILLTDWIVGNFIIK